MAQALGSAMSTVPSDRAVTSLQMTFLAGPRPEAPIEYAVAALQDGKRVSSRSVLARQGERAVTSAFVSAHAASHAPTGAGEPERSSADARPLHTLSRSGNVRPDDALDLSDFPPALLERLRPSGFLEMGEHPHIECRFVDPESLHSGHADTVRFWIRIRHELPEDPHVHAAALAYLSDWWLPFAGIAEHLEEEPGGFYLASLNHSVWFHAPCRANEWLLHETQSPWASRSRGLSFGRLFRIDGTMVASVAQECLQTARLLARR